MSTPLVSFSSTISDVILQLRYGAELDTLSTLDTACGTAVATQTKPGVLVPADGCWG